MLKPPAGKPVYVVLRPETKTLPKVVFGVTALKWIHALVQEHSTEVGFYGVVDELPDYTFFIRDIFYPKHSEMHGGTCEISPEGENDLMQWLIEKGKDADIEKVRFWGHSHVNMGTGPSGQDETQGRERMENTQSFLIRAIVNKKGDMQVSFFDYNEQVRFDHIKWTWQDDTDPRFREQIIAESKAILNDDSKSTEEKLKAVHDLTSKDAEMDRIIEKVKELKEVNAPPTKITHTGGYPEKQTAMFEHTGRAPYGSDRGLKKNSTRQSTTTFPNAHDDYDEVLDNERVNDIMTKWEDEYVGR